MKVHRLGSAAYYNAVALHHDETSCVQPTASGGDTDSENGHFRYLIPSYFHIHSYTCIYVHIRAYTCFSHLVVFCPLHLHILAYTCIYLHILAYTRIYWHIRAGGGGLRGGHALTPTASSIRVRVSHCTILSMPDSPSQAASCRLRVRARRLGVGRLEAAWAIQIRQWRSQTRVGQRPAVGKGQPLSKTE